MRNQAKLSMVVDLWLTVCGYSYSSAWVEKYKVAQKKSTQKSKGIRKQLYAFVHVWLYVCSD